MISGYIFLRFLGYSVSFFRAQCNENGHLMESKDSVTGLDRQKALLNWLRNDCGFTTVSLQPMQGAASFRRYFRIVDSRHASWVVMDAPPAYENCRPYVAIANALRRMKLHIPEIVAANIDQGFLLLTDFGDTTYLEGLNAENADGLYGHAFSSLAILQGCQTVPGHSLPLFTNDLMWQEWRWCKEWFLNKLLQLTLHHEKDLDACYEKIVTSAIQQPQVFMHRDFHSGNLMVLPNKAVGILDFQDAFIGPITYDLVSLLRDCYIDWPKEQVRGWVNRYKAQLSEVGMLQEVSQDTFLLWFDWMGMQRHFKALFTFARKRIRDLNAALSCLCTAYVAISYQYE